jgi:hypothetical protein
MTRTIGFTLNGEPVAAEIKPHHNLVEVEVLQREFNLMGARESCGQGMCGCCTVLVNGTAVSGCLYLAAFVDGADVTTVEHLANGARRPSLRPAPSSAASARLASCLCPSSYHQRHSAQTLFDRWRPSDRSLRGPSRVQNLASDGRALRLSKFCENSKGMGNARKRMALHATTFVCSKRAFEGEW